MARKARELSSKGLYYVELRGDELYKTEEDKEQFKSLIKESFSDGGKIYGCVLEKNSFRMVVKESVKGISMAMKSVTVSYARYFNRTHGGEGSIFADRFKSIPYESEAEAKRAAKAIEDGAISVSQNSGTEKKNTKATVKAKATPAKKKSSEVKAKSKPEVKKASGTKKAEVKKVKEVKEVKEIKEVKEVKEIKEEVKEQPKPKRNRSLPSWLL